jgi:hypothetical protein
MTITPEKEKQNAQVVCCRPVGNRAHNLEYFRGKRYVLRITRLSNTNSEERDLRCMQGDERCAELEVVTRRLYWLVGTLPLKQLPSTVVLSDPGQASLARRAIYSRQHTAPSEEAHCPRAQVKNAASSGDFPPASTLCFSCYFHPAKLGLFAIPVGRTDEGGCLPHIPGPLVLRRLVEYPIRQG